MARLVQIPLSTSRCDLGELTHERSEWPRVGVARATEGGFRVLDRRASADA